MPGSGGMPKRPMVLASAWAVVLLTAAAAFGRTGLGSALATIWQKRRETIPQQMTSQHAQHAHRHYWQQLKGRPADW